MNIAIPQSRRRAFTIVEATISVVIVSIVLTAALTAVGSAAKGRYINLQKNRGAMLTQDLMSEIMQSLYKDAGSSPTFGLESGESTGNRSAFNDVDDYNNWSESPPQYKSGTTIPGYTGWTRAVSVAWVLAADATTVSGSETGLKKITVTVTAPDGRTYKLVSLRSSYGWADHHPGTSISYTGQIRLELQSGDSSTERTVHAIRPLNQVP